MYQGEFGPVSNRGAWSESVSLLQSADDEPPVLTEIELAFGLKGGGSKTTKTMTDGDISYDEDTGIFSFVIPETVMRVFKPGTYDLGITITIGGTEEQLFAGTLAIYDGVVS